MRIIAHRGASKACLENSRAAFAQALAEGADGIELDVHASRDGVVIVHHDAVIRDSVTGTSMVIADCQAAELADVRLANGEPLPLLDDALDIIGSRAWVYVELKAGAIERAVVECLDRHPAARAAVHAFDHRLPVRVRELRSEVPIGLLSTSYPLDLAGFIGAARCDAFWQHADVVDRELVRAAGQLGVETIVWTVNDLSRARELSAMGVTAVCTDTPARIRSGIRT